MIKNLDFWYFWNLFRKHWVFLLVAAVVGGVAGYCISNYLIADRYRANVSLYIGRLISDGDQREESSMPAQRSLSTELTLGLQLANDYKALINSRTLTRKVEEVVGEKYPDRPLKYHVSVDVVRQTRLISVNVVSTDPVICMEVANTMADLFIETVQEILNIRNSRIIDSAELPEHPFYPSNRRNTLIGFVLGALAAFGLVFLRNILDTTIRTPDDAVAVLELPIMGTIPRDDRLLRQESQPGGARNQILAADDGERFDIAEAFRTMRTNLQYSDAGQGNRGKIFVLTSTFPGEGKTFNSANLGVALADSGKKTLIINCDLHKPALAKAFGQESGQGVVNVLVGEKSFNDVVVRNVMNLPLDLLLCGPIPPNPSRLLLSDTFRALLEKLRGEYDYILLDAPPCLTIADAAIVGGLADGVLLVVQAGRTRSEVLQRACQQLRQMKLNVLGIILNRFVSAESDHYGYG